MSISGTAGLISAKFCVQIRCGHGSILLWWGCDTLNTSGFMDDVMFGHNGRDAEMWRLHRAVIATNGVAIPGRCLMSMNACYFWDDWMSTDLVTLLYEATSVFRLLPVVNGLHTSQTAQRVKKLVCLKDWSYSMDWVCELNNNCDFN